MSSRVPQKVHLPGRAARRRGRKGGRMKGPASPIWSSDSWNIPFRGVMQKTPTTRRQVSEQVNSFRDAKALPFHDVLDAAMVEQALDAEGVRFNESTYTPFVTLCAFLSQVLDPDHSCRGAVAKLIVWLTSVVASRVPRRPAPIARRGSACPWGSLSDWSARPARRSRAARPKAGSGRGDTSLSSTAPPPRCPTPRRTRPLSRSRRPRASAWVPAGPVGRDHLAG